MRCLLKKEKFGQLKLQWMFKMKKISENIYEIPKEGGMLVPGRIFFSDKIIKNVEIGRAHV